MSLDSQALGLLETTGFTPAMVALDAMEKSGSIQVVQAELNDFLGVVVKITGPTADVDTAVSVGHAVAQRMGGKPVSRTISHPSPDAEPALISRDEFNPLIQQHVVHQGSAMAQSASHDAPFAIGFLETQGFTAVFEAIDTACKTAGVEVIGKEKLGGGYVTVVIKGDVAAVNAAIDAGKGKVAGLGTLIAAHVIARPSPAVLGLLPSQ